MMVGAVTCFVVGLLLAWAAPAGWFAGFLAGLAANLLFGLIAMFYIEARLQEERGRRWKRVRELAAAEVAYSVYVLGYSMAKALSIDVPDFRLVEGKADQVPEGLALLALKVKPTPEEIEREAAGKKTVAEVEEARRIMVAFSQAADENPYLESANVVPVLILAHADDVFVVAMEDFLIRYRTALWEVRAGLARKSPATTFFTKSIHQALFAAAVAHRRATAHLTDGGKLVWGAWTDGSQGPRPRAVTPEVERESTNA